MHVRSKLCVLCAAVFWGAVPPVAAQAVYKCSSGSSVTYSQQPCEGRVVNTREAYAPRDPSSQTQAARRAEHNRLLAQSLRRQPGETTAQFDSRRRRVGMLPGDRQECARLDKSMPVEKARLENPDQGEVKKAQEALAQDQKRFAEMRC